MEYILCIHVFCWIPAQQWHLGLSPKGSSIDNLTSGTGLRRSHQKHLGIFIIFISKLHVLVHSYVRFLKFIMSYPANSFCGVWLVKVFHRPQAITTTVSLLYSHTYPRSLFLSLRCDIKDFFLKCYRCSDRGLMIVSKMLAKLRHCTLCIKIAELNFWQHVFVSIYFFWSVVQICDVMITVIDA